MKHLITFTSFIFKSEMFITKKELLQENKILKKQLCSNMKMLKEKNLFLN